MSHTPPELPNAPKDAERLKAWELYLSSNTEGKPRSLRSIAGTLGLNPATVRRWASVDGWEQKVNAILSQSAQTAEATQNAIKRQVRRGLLDGLGELRRLALGAQKEADRVSAVKALVDIAIRIEAVTAAASAGKSESADVAEFNDELPEDDQWPLATSEIPTNPTDSLSLPGEPISEPLRSESEESSLESPPE